MATALAYQLIRQLPSSASALRQIYRSRRCSGDASDFLGDETLPTVPYSKDRKAFLGAHVRSDFAHVPSAPSFSSAHEMLIRPLL